MEKWLTNEKKDNYFYFAHKLSEKCLQIVKNKYIINSYSEFALVTQKYLKESDLQLKRNNKIKNFFLTMSWHGVSDIQIKQN